MNQSTMAHASLRRKAIIVGDGMCGKTCMLSVFVRGHFPEVFIPTIFENQVAQVNVDGREIELALWDTAGQEGFDRLRLLSYPDSHVVLICFSVDSHDSLENVYTKWYTEVLAHSDAPIVLVACKKDTRKKDPSQKEAMMKHVQRIVSYEEGANMAQRIGAAAYVECSALHNDGVREVFEQATRMALLARTRPRGGGGCCGCVVA